jgi:ornithine--oxo-acid transaminase
MKTKQNTLTEKYIENALKFSAENYAPLPVVLKKAQGIHVTDVEGKNYIDMLSAYSAVNQGHQHPRIVQALINQSQTLALTSRAFHNDKMGAFLEKLCSLSDMEKALPMNTGAEAVETALKCLRKWGYEKKGIPENQAEIIVCADNFHGRTITIVGFSTDPDARKGFGPATPGFKIVPYDDAPALEAAVNENTCGILVEPIQGEAGVRIPSQGYLKSLREIADRHNVLLCFDEIQTGLGRTGKLFCWQHEEVKPDMMTVGKALGGGLYPISAMLTSSEVMSVFTPGSHGSTFGGNPLAAAVGSAALEVIIEENLVDRAKEMGDFFMQRLAPLSHKDHIREIRGKGLLIAIEMKEALAKQKCKELAQKGILAKDTHQSTVRFAPPLIISREEIEKAAETIVAVFRDIL